ncbi:DUF1249 domain-containing protein [Undibacterium aquatile]|uniref:DUF1249 domain-containing protein n=1 Tax=Undibacterium aquatile TaxID=1537398 RepID=A0ABR6XCS7_9BURK|nr:DUF1249 domain-containing protein [Undibacterium aquatile]MBC3810104.1 DUF1249 domain-containing protein [Undibacterium aquatile]
MSNEKLHQSIYSKLLDVVPDLHTIESNGKSVVGGGIMDLCFDVLSRSDSKIVIALSHYYKHPSGDMIADPDMEIAVYPKRQVAEALSFQDATIYRTVYSSDRLIVDIRAKKDLNDFLNFWLTNLIQQGHSIKVGVDGDA